MPAISLLDHVPLWGVFVGTSLLVIVCIELGYRVGRYRHAVAKNEKESPVGAMVGATLGLLAFLLAFTFGLAAARFDDRKGVLLDEANAIGTLYLRAAMLPEHGPQVRALLREYVDVRLQAVRTGNVTAAIQRSEEIQNQLWSHATDVATNNPNSIIVGLFVQALNEVIDLHAKRVTLSLRNRIPGPIWAALYAVAMLSLAAMGYHGGVCGTTRSLATLAVAITFSLVIWLVVDLDRPAEGTIRIDQQVMIDLQNSMKQ